jgi:hypothetical protein
LEEDMDKPIMMAACGLDCGSCEIRLAATDPAAAKVVVDWFRKEGWLKEDEGIERAIERNMLCAGCLGDKNAHWDSSCWILVCCVDDKGLSNCSECNQFPCLKLVEWSEQNDGYRRAFEKLKAILAGK